MVNNMTDNITLLEKYQPGTLADIHGHDTIRQILTSMVEQENIPHMMFTGSPGNGKSTTAMALINASKSFFISRMRACWVKITDA